MISFFSDLQRRRFTSLPLLSLTAIGLGSFALRPFSAQAAEPEPTQRLMEMFSPQIRDTMNACREQGQVNLTAGAGTNGGVICGDGTVAEVPFQTYLNTVSDFLAASTLLGMRQQIAVTPEVTPDRLLLLFDSDEGRSFLQNTLQTGLLQSGMLSPNSDPAPLTNQIISKLLPTVQRTNYLQTLLGSETQYNQVVQSFCTAPGMSVEQAQQTVPGLDAVQLYAICIKESGLAN